MGLLCKCFVGCDPLVIPSSYNVEFQGCTEALTLKHRFHQLHCLASLRKAPQESHDGKDIGVDWQDDDHWPHCLHCLYQVLYST